MNVKFERMKVFSDPQPALLRGGHGGSPVPAALLSMKRTVGTCTVFLSAVIGSCKMPPLLGMGSLKEDGEGKRGCGGHSPTHPAPRCQPCPTKWKPLQELVCHRKPSEKLAAATPCLSVVFVSSAWRFHYSLCAGQGLRRAPASANSQLIIYF